MSTSIPELPYNVTYRNKVLREMTLKIAVEHVTLQISWSLNRSPSAIPQFRHLTSCLLLAVIVLAAGTVVGAPEDQAFIETSLTLEWRESPTEIAAGLSALNKAFVEVKGARGARFATYSIRNADKSIFELYDQDGLYTTTVKRRDFSHELELRFKTGAHIDYEALPQSKQISVVIDAVAKSEVDIRRLVQATDFEEALNARTLLNTPSALTIAVKIADVDERPVVASSFDPMVNHERGYLIRMHESDRSVVLAANQIFLDPEGRPLYLKPDAEDIEVREYGGYSPYFGSQPAKIGDTNSDTNTLAGNSPVTDGSIVRVSTGESSITIATVKGTREGIRKAEILIRGWDQRGPTAMRANRDPATAVSVAKITVLVQTGSNSRPRWAGNATGFGVNVKEGYNGTLLPQTGTWNATDPDGDSITYSLLDTTTAGACAQPRQSPGISFGGACLRLDSADYVSFSLIGNLDYETVRKDPVGYFTLAAMDTFGAVAEVRFQINVIDVDEPIRGGFESNALSIHLPTTNLKRIDLSTLFLDPEQRETFTYRASSTSPAIVSVNTTPTPVLELTAHKLGNATIHAWATSESGSIHSSMTVYVKDTNEPPNFPNEVARYQFNVLENTPRGTKLLNTISATDIDVGDVLSFSLQENRHFRLTNEGLARNHIQFVTTAPLDYEAQREYLLILTVSDGVATADVEVLFNISNVDESVEATAETIDPIHLGKNGVRILNAATHFVSQDGYAPVIHASAYEPSIVEVFVRDDGEVHIFGKRNGTTTVTLTATDMTSGVATKQFTVIVEESNPPVVKQPLQDQTMRPGLLELSIANLFTDPDGEFTVGSASSSDEDVLWVIQPKNEPNTLILYAWAVGIAKITISAHDPTGNETSFTFSVSVSDDVFSEEDALIPDQTLVVGQKFGSISLLDVFSTEQEQSASFRVESSQSSVVDAVLGSSDPVAWWHTLECAQKIAAVGDTGVANDANPYCRDFASLRAQHRVIVRAVGEHHVLLHGIAVGSAEITVIVTYESGASETATFTTSVEPIVASIASSVPHRVVYPNATLELSIEKMFGFHKDMSRLQVATRRPGIAEVGLSDDSSTLLITGLQIGSTDVALIGMDQTKKHYDARFSLRVANRMPKFTDATLELRLEIGDDPHVQDLLTIFSDDEALTFALVASDRSIVDVNLNGSTLVLTALRKGAMTLSIRATDRYDASVAASLEVTVSDHQLSEIAQASLTGYGRAVLNSVSSVIGSRLTKPLMVSDLTSDHLRHEERVVDNPSFVNPNQRSTLSPVNHAVWAAVPRSATPRAPSSLPRLTKSFKESESTRYWTLWTDSDTQSYQSDGYQGRLRAIYLGTEVVMSSRLQAGLAGSRIQGTGEYVYGTANRWFESEQHMISPYMRYQRNDDESIWAIASIGAGTLATPAHSRQDDQYHDLRTAAWLVGATRRVAQGNRFNLAWTGDVAHLVLSADAKTASDRNLSTEVDRIRGGLTASINVPMSAHSTFEPFAEINLRYDGGSDHSGGGVELVGGARFTFGAFNLEMRGRTFTMRDDIRYREEGFAISTTYKPSNNIAGWSISLAPSWGDSKQSFNPFGSDCCVPRRLDEWLEDNTPQSTFALDSSLSYGVLTYQDRILLIPYAQTRINTNRDQRLGVRLEGTTTRLLELDAAIQRTGFLYRETDTGFMLTGTLRL